MKLIVRLGAGWKQAGGRLGLGAWSLGDVSPHRRHLLGRGAKWLPAHSSHGGILDTVTPGKSARKGSL